MTEHTDKPPQKADRTPPRKRAAKARTPEVKRAKAPGTRQTAGANEALPPAGTADAATRSRLAPDPATVVFGSNRPIAAPPPKLPEGSGLRFSGPSAGILKASGPQPNSAKASGLTFTAAKPAPASTVKPAPGKPVPSKPAPAARPPVAKKPDAKSPEPGKTEAEGAGVKKAPLTKPAIAPQVTGPRFGKERSTGGFVLVMLLIAVFGGGLAFWTKLESEKITPQLATVNGAASSDAGSGDAAPAEARQTEPVAEGRRVETAPSASLAAADSGLSVAEVGEIQQLLSYFDLDPGRTDGVLTAATASAIRDYQEMAGLPADGEANRALLEELRSVAALYGS